MTLFLCVDRQLLVFSHSIETDLIFVMVEIDLICVGDRTWLDFSAGMKYTSKYLVVAWGGRKWLHFSVVDRH